MNRILFLFCAAVASVALGAVTPLKGVHRLTILHTNDQHGRFWPNDKGDAGMLSAATVIRQIQDEVTRSGGHSLLLSAGDVNTGTPESDLANAQPDFLAMNYLKYDAMAVGNHEFDKPFDYLLLQLGRRDPIEAEKKTVRAQFPVLAANLFYRKNGEPVFQRTLEKELGQLKVAIFGLTTPQAEQGAAMNFPRRLVTTRSSAEVAREMVPRLREQAHIVIALAHLGYYPDKEMNIEDPSKAPGSIALARAVPGIDIIIDGHSHDALQTPAVVSNTIIVQAQDSFQYVGRLDLVYDDGVLRLEKGQLIPVTAKIAEDKTLKKLVSGYRESALKIMAEKVGMSLGKFEGDRKVIRFKETNLGNLVTHIMKESPKLKEGQPADVAVICSGVIRTSLPQGEINYGHILNIHPFNLKYVAVDLKGNELFDFLAQVAKKEPGGDGCFPQLAGVKLTVVKGRLVDARLNTGNIVPSRKYKVVTTSFEAGGNLGYPEIAGHPTFRDLGVVDASVTREYIRRNSPLDPNDFKVTGYYVRKP